MRRHHEIVDLLGERALMKRRVIAAATSLVLIMCVAAAARGIYAWTQVRQTPDRLLGLVPFANETGNIALSMAQGNGFSSPFLQETGPTAWLTPVYPAVVTAAFKVFGIRTAHAFYAVLVLNILCSVAACVPIFWIGRRVGGVATGALAAWMWALLPTAIIIPYQWVWDTSLAALLLALITAATLSPAATWGIFDWCGYGLLWGFALMTNPSLAAALPFLFLWAAVRSIRADEQVVRWKHAGMALGIAVLCCVPWTVRNYRAFHTWVPLRTTLPLQLWLGNNNLYDPDYSGPVAPNAAREDIRQYARTGEIAFMSAKGAEAREFISGHRGLYAELTWRRVMAFWTGLEHPWSGFFEAESLVVRVVVAVNVFTFLAMICGVVVLARRRVAEGLVLAAWVAAYPVVFYLTRTLLRYRNVVEPVIVVLAAVAIMGIVRMREVNTVQREVESAD
jgi:4-amino-4-deoxy-L-arabinose transferase-like glycosyltransferase